jgi:hypothetical protein
MDGKIGAVYCLVHTKALVMLDGDSKEEMTRYQEMLADRLAAAFPEWREVRVEMASHDQPASKLAELDAGGSSSTTTTVTTTTSTTSTTLGSSPGSGGGDGIREVHIHYILK